ncbi:MAG TPA: glycosyltransferase family 2 protein [Gemmatimonadaceae bacterium]
MTVPFPPLRSQIKPRVSMGMPVYNGEQFVEEALRSLLAQTYEAFEILISDNASTDRTSEICQDYASRDPRIRYRRNPKNLGFAINQNSVIEHGAGEFFLLTHHDDVRLPTYLERTIAVLDQRPEVVVCYTVTRDIDEHGEFLPRVDPPLRVDSANTGERFRDIIRMDHLCEADFGLTRLNVLRETRLHGDYADSDRVMLAELLLRGPFHRIQDCLFHRRAHANQSTAIAPNRQTRTVWYNPAYKNGIVFPHFRQWREYLSAIGRASVPLGTRAACYGAMVGWLGTNRARLFDDAAYAGREVLRPFYHALRGSHR